MNLTLAVDMGEGPVNVQTNLFVMVQYERKYKRKASEMASGIGFEDLLFLAYESCKIHGITVPAVFDDFIKRAVSIEVISEDTDANPTPGLPTDTL
jgi:hypothetical protein